MLSIPALISSIEAVISSMEAAWLCEFDEKVSDAESRFPARKDSWVDDSWAEESIVWIMSYCCLLRATSSLILRMDDLNML